MNHGNAKDTMMLVIMVMLAMLCYDGSYYVHDGYAKDAMMLVAFVMMVSSSSYLRVSFLILVRLRTDFRPRW